MGIFRNNGGIMNVIRCDEPSYLIWKWHPADSAPGGNARENAIRLGSSLRVKDGETAVFVYRQADGTMQDIIEGPFDGILHTKNLPVLAGLVGLAYNGGTPFQAEVYFINMAQLVQVRFGVPFFDVYDPRFLDYGVPVAVRGTISVGITDCRAFIKLHRLINFTLRDFEQQIRDVVCRYVKDVVANAPAEHNMPVIQIESKTAMINDAVEYNIAERLKENFGVTVSGVDISAIEIDKLSEGYRQLISITKDVTTATIKAETAMKVKDIHEKQRIEAKNYEESLRIQREEERYAQHMHTRTANIGAYQVEKQTEASVAGAAALGQMGANGVGTINMGSDGGMGFNPAAMMANMAVGGVVGQNIAGVMSNAMSGMNQGGQSGIMPPPIPTPTYYVAINGQAAGPCELLTLRQMVQSGQLTKQTLVWKQGMADWERAAVIQELNVLWSQIPPDIPGGG